MNGHIMTLRHSVSAVPNTWQDMVKILLRLYGYVWRSELGCHIKKASALLWSIV